MNESTGTTTTGTTTDEATAVASHSISFDGILPVPSDPGLIFGQEITGTFRARVDGVNLRRDWTGKPDYTARVTVLGFELGEVAIVQGEVVRSGSMVPAVPPSRTRRARAALRRFSQSPFGAAVSISGGFGACIVIVAAAYRVASLLG